MLEKLISWLKTFPLWEDTLTVDYNRGTIGSAGLYPGGVEEIERREDILGNVTVRNRAHFDLTRVTTGQQDSYDNAAWLLAFQDWVQTQSRKGLAPVFGSEPAREVIRAKQGKLKTASQTGTGTYTVHLTADYVIKGERENGEN